MCGIAGIKLFNNLPSKTDEASLWNALQTQTHRGPDNTTVKIHGYSALGHNRLSIIDTNVRSNQPFTDESGRYSLIFNGEIYNFHELKTALESKGYSFKTTSDTEVLFFLLIEKKAAALEELRGCFAFAFYDRQEDYMLLARDRMGINPLLYSLQDDRLLFGSELFVFKGLGLTCTISDDALNDYFRYTYIPAPKTIYNEIQKLPAGHYIEIQGSDFSMKSYWDPRSETTFQGSFEEAKMQLKERVEFAVHSQLEADVPIGTFLSGGVDSSLVSAIAKRHKADLHTFSVSFGDQQEYDESAYALLVAKHIQSEHHVIRLTESDFKLHFQEILDSFDEPFADSSAIAMWFLSRETARHLKVALSGDGADELLAGYNKHKAFLQARKLNLAKKTSYRLAEKVLNPLLAKRDPKKLHRLQKFNTLSRLDWPENYWFLASNIGEQAKDELLLYSFKTPYIYTADSNGLNDFLWLDQKFVLANDMLKKVDLMSMHHSLEVRTPFMDKDLVRFANSLPAEWKIKDGTGKYILKETFRGVLPDEIFDRAKQGFEVPVNAWIRTSWKELIPELWFDAGFLREQNIFRPSAVQSLKARFFNKSGTASQEMWAYLVFQNWYQKIHQHA
ncbi:MAG: asparagine synthase (glutamine-hydrolyzing) [Bacteroidota bacterium]